jgi:hypothetical protein
MEWTDLMPGARQSCGQASFIDIIWIRVENRGRCLQFVRGAKPMTCSSQKKKYIFRMAYFSIRSEL